MSTPLPISNYSQISYPTCFHELPTSLRNSSNRNYAQASCNQRLAASCEIDGVYPEERVPRVRSCPPTLAFPPYPFEGVSLTLFRFICHGARHAHLTGTACHSCVSLLQDARETHSRPVRPQMPVADVSSRLPHTRRDPCHAD